MAEELLVTQGKQMRAMREQGVVLIFPSGNKYRVRIPTAAGLLKRGDLPNMLISYIADVFYKGDPEGEKYDAFRAPTDDAERIMEMLRSFRIICEEMFMEPRIVDNPQNDNEVSIVDLSVNDQSFAFWLAFVDAKALEPFRQQQAPNVVGVAMPKDVPSETVAGA